MEKRFVPDGNDVSPPTACQTWEYRVANAKEAIFNKMRDRLNDGDRQSVLMKYDLLPRSKSGFKSLLSELHEGFFYSDPSSPEYKKIYHFLILAGLLEPIFYGDWKVNRDSKTYARDLGFRSIGDLMQMIVMRIGDNNDNKYSHVDIGSGAGTLVKEARGLDTGEVIWDHHGTGDKMYFSLNEMIKKFAIDPGNQTKMAVIGMLSYFVTRELREGIARDKKHFSSPVIQIGQIWRIFSHLPDWLHKYFDRSTGEYLDSGEFEDDSLMRADEHVLGMLNGFSLIGKVDNADNKKFLLLSKFLELFRPEFVEQIFSDQKLIRIENELEVDIEGFILELFENFKDMQIVPGSFDLVTGSKSDSHATDDVYISLQRQLCRGLEYGAVDITNGFQQSYTRIFRLRSLLLNVINCNQELWAHVVIDRASDYPLSTFIEKSIKDGASSTYYDNSQLAVGFDMDRVLLMPLKAVAFRDDLVLEEEVRRYLFDAVAWGDSEIFREKNGSIRDRVLEVLNHKGPFASLLFSEPEKLRTLTREVVTSLGYFFDA